MKLFEYGRCQLIFVNGTQYTVEGTIGYKDAPWDRISPNKIYIATIEHGKILKADHIEADSNFSGTILKSEPQSPELYQATERMIIMQAMDKLLAISSAPKYPSSDLIHTPLDVSWIRNENN